MEMENILNILHYCIYKAHYHSHLLFNKINPFRLIHKLPFQKRRYQELGIDIEGEINEAFGNKTYGLSIMVSGGAIMGILFLLIMALALLMIKVAKLNIILTTPHFIVFTSISLVMCYFLVFRNDKYLKYFKLYEKLPRNKKIHYGWLSLIFTVAVLLLFILSL
jgi:hypothetical protein